MWLSAVSTTETFLQFFTVIFVFVLVLVLAYFSTKWIAKYQSGQRKGTNIEVVESCFIGNGKHIQIIRVADTYLAIAVCKETVTFLGEIKKDALQFSGKNGGAMPSFVDLFRKARDMKDKEWKDEYTDCEHKEK